MSHSKYGDVLQMQMNKELDRGCKTFSGPLMPIIHVSQIGVVTKCGGIIG